MFTKPSVYSTSSLASRVCILLAALQFFSACTTKKKIVYFQGAGSASEATSKNYTPVFHSDDLLSILVGGLDPDAVKPFNLQVSTNMTTQYGGYTTGTPSQPGYLIDSNGNIDFPVIGQVHLGGLDRMAATELLKEKLKPYITNPIVNMRMLNFKVTVLGEVRNPGTFTIPNERITLLEAIGIAGDLNITALRKNVLVIRDIDGKKTETRVDLTSKQLFNSPVYYLNQNDVVYVEPNRTKINSGLLNPSNAGIIISAISLIVTVMVLLSR